MVALLLHSITHFIVAVLGSGVYMSACRVLDTIFISRGNSGIARSVRRAPRRKTRLSQ